MRAEFDNPIMSKCQIELQKGLVETFQVCVYVSVDRFIFIANAIEIRINDKIISEFFEILKME